MRSIRWKIILVSTVLVYLPVLFLGRYAVISFDKFTSKALEEEMISQAVMLGEQYRAMVLEAGDTDGFSALIGRYYERIQSRLQILSGKGIVIFDSDPDTMVGSDFSDRKEVVNAINGGKYEAAWKLIPAYNRVYYFVPVPIIQNDHVEAVAYVTHHTSQITKAIKRIKTDHKKAMVIALFVSVLLSALIAQTMTHRLRRLTAAAFQYARDGQPLKIDTTGRDEIAELGQTMQYMADEINKRNDYNRDFISTLMHELKTPVTAIKGSVEVLQQGAVDRKESRDKFLSNISYEADRMIGMVGELNELIRIDTDMLTDCMERVEYGTCMRGILDRLVPTFEEKRAELSTVIPAETIMVSIVPGRIEQVTANILDNAFRYTPAAGFVELKIQVGEDGKQVLTSIRDTGSGITPIVIGRVFDRFFTTERRNVPRDYGNGLGLAIAKRIIENHKGRIWVDSQPGSGSTFTWSLPIVK